MGTLDKEFNDSRLSALAPCNLNCSVLLLVEIHGKTKKEYVMLRFTHCGAVTSRRRICAFILSLSGIGLFDSDVANIFSDELVTSSSHFIVCFLPYHMQMFRFIPYNLSKFSFAFSAPPSRLLFAYTRPKTPFASHTTSMK